MGICKSIAFCAGIVLLVATCKSPSDKIMDEFNKVNDSLKNANAEIIDNDSLTLISLSILAMQKQNPQLAIEADSIYLATTNATAFIDSIKNVLSEDDTTGENTEVGMRLMTANNTGDQLYHYLLSVYDYTLKASNTKNKDSNRVYADVYEVPSSSTFIQKYFQRTPTMGAITILTKLKDDCVVTAIATLNDIKGQLKYK